MPISQLRSLIKTYNNPKDWIRNVLWRFPHTISESDCIFVVGSPRSGTTLLQRMLSLHSQLFSIEAETALFSYLNIFNEKSKHFGLSQETLQALYYDCVDIVDFFEKGVALLSLQNANKRFVEKTPQHILRLPFLLRHFPKSKIIHIVRDGRDCYCSARSHPSIPQRKTVSIFARYWRDCVKKGKVTNTDRMLTVSYEQMCRSPSPTIHSIMQFLQMNAEAHQLSADDLGKDKRALLPHFSRLSTDIDSSSVGRWRAELTTTEIAEFERIAGKELDYYGYDLSRR